VILGDDSAQRFRDALRRIADGEIEEGVRRLQSVHEQAWGRNHMMLDPELASPDGDWTVAVSLTDRLIRAIGELSPAAQRFYISEYTLSARTLIDRALVERDAKSLRRTADLYPITAEAPIALLAAGDIHFEADRLALAAEAWGELRRRSRAGGPHEDAIALREQLLAARRGDRETREAARATLGARGIPIPEGSPAPSDEASGVPPPLPFARGRLEWRSISFARENQFRSATYGTGGTVPYASVPVFGPGWVAVPTSRKLLRFDLDSGKQVGEVSLSPYARYFEDDRLVRFSAVADGDLVVTSYVAGASQPDEYLGYDITVEVPLRGLKGVRVGLDRTIWDTAKRKGSDPLLAELSFNGEPVLAGGHLYALGWRKKGYIDVFLVCLDARTGERLWSSPLVGNQVELTMFGETAHEPLLGSVAVAEGAVFCSTNLGVVARVRASDGHVIWATEYEAQRRRAFRGRRSQYRMRPVWDRNPILLHEDRLIATPLDSADLIVIDTETGIVRQRVAGESGFLVGILDENLVLARSEVRLLPVRDVSRGGGTRTPLPGELRARPALVDGGLVFATEDGLFHLPLSVWRGAVPAEAVKLCSLIENAYDPGERDPVTDGTVSVLPDRILVTSSQRTSCYLAEPIPEPEETPR